LTHQKIREVMETTRKQHLAAAALAGAFDETWRPGEIELSKCRPRSAVSTDGRPEESHA